MTLAHDHAPANTPYAPIAAIALAATVEDALSDIQAHAAPCESLTALVMIGGAAADLAHAYADEHAPIPFALTPAGIDMIGGAK